MLSDKTYAEATAQLQAEKDSTERELQDLYAAQSGEQLV